MAENLASAEAVQALAGSEPRQFDGPPGSQIITTRTRILPSKSLRYQSVSTMAILKRLRRSSERKNA